MLKKASAQSTKRKAEPVARWPPKQPSVKQPTPKPTALKQPTLSFGKPAPAPEKAQAKRPAPAEDSENRQTQSRQDDGIVWSFSDPKKRPEPKQTAKPMLSQAEAQIRGNHKTNRQVDKLLNIMSRGKQRRQQSDASSLVLEDRASSVSFCTQFLH